MDNKRLESLYNQNRIILQKSYDDFWVHITKLEPIWEDTQDGIKNFSLNSKAYYYNSTNNLPNKSLSNLTKFVRDILDLWYNKWSKDKNNLYLLK